MTLTDAEIAALVGAVVVLANALASYLLNQASKERAILTQTKIGEVHARVDAVARTVNTNPAAAPLVDGHEVIPHG